MTAMNAVIWVPLVFAAAFGAAIDFLNGFGSLPR